MARARTNGFDFVYERVETRSPRSRFLAVGSSLAPGQKPVGVRAWSAGRDGTGWDGIGWDGIGLGRDRLGRDRLGRDRLGRDSNGTGLERDGRENGHVTPRSGFRRGSLDPRPTWALGSGPFRT
jgi:hypothetical protein